MHVELVDQLRSSFATDCEEVFSFSRKTVSGCDDQQGVPMPKIPPSAVTVEEEIRSYAQQFSVIVVFSTFVAGVIVAYLQLMDGILPSVGDATRADDPVYLSALRHREMGFGFGFTGLVWNLAIAIVAGADTAACASGAPWKTIEDIRSRFAAFVFAQFLGAVVFGGCIGILLYPVHSGHFLVALPMLIFPTAVIMAGIDTASIMEEFRWFKEDIKRSVLLNWQWATGPFRNGRT